MKNVFGNNLTLTLFGESHGPLVGCVLDGLTPGLLVSEEEIGKALARRRPSSPDIFTMLVRGFTSVMRKFVPS